jgi:hypothetical protein
MAASSATLKNSVKVCEGYDRVGLQYINLSDLQDHTRKSQVQVSTKGRIKNQRPDIVVSVTLDLL